MTLLAHRYEPRGSALTVFEARDPEVLIVGPAGTGKTRACLEKLHTMALLNPGMRALMVRKTASSLTASGLVTWKRDVIPESSPLVEFYGGSPEEPPQYRYRNGSKVVIGGMDRASKIMSTEYDLIYVQEATELTEDDWEALTSRLRSNVVSFQQLLADCNPAQDTHWLKARCDRGQTRQIFARHIDNPVLFDEDEQPTETGAAYMARLEALSGVRYRRLFKGEWSSAEGIIYEDWDSAVHLVDRFPVPDEWPRWWAVDFGFTNPMVIQNWAEDPDGRLYLYREWYRTQRTVDQHAADVLAVVAPDGAWSEPKPRAVVCDHDAEGIEQLRRRLGLPMWNAHKQVSAGIEAVMRRLRTAGDGRPRLFIMRDSVVSPDETLREAGRPAGTADEVTGYIWAPTQDGKPQKEEPLKVDDHGMDAMRYMVMARELDGAAEILKPTITHIPARR